MPQLLPLKCMRVVALFQVGTEEIATNTWHLDRGTLPLLDQTRADLIASRFRAFYNSTHNVLAEDVQLAEIKTYDTGPNPFDAGAGGGYALSTMFSTPQAAGIVGPAGTRLPRQLACAVTLETARAGRRGRGRIFLGPLGASALDTNGRLIDVQRGAILNAAVVLRTALSTDGNPLAVLSRAEPAALPLVTAFSMDQVIDTQRRRRSAVRGVRTRSTG